MKLSVPYEVSFDTGGNIVKFHRFRPLTQANILLNKIVSKIENLTSGRFSWNVMFLVIQEL